MTRSMLIIATIVTAMIMLASCAADQASAHPLPKASPFPGLHKICTAIGKCHDTLPRPPLGPCDHANDGLQEEIWDPFLETYVTWECWCPPWPDQPCGWRRLAITHSWHIGPVTEVHRRWVRDRQRKCPSIVCKSVWVRHFYPTLFAMGGKL